MNWNDVKNLIGSAAPVLGSVIGGPAGGAIGTLVSTALGVDNTPDAVATALKDNPKALLEMQRLEQEHKHELEKALIDAEIAKYKADKADFKNARSRDTQLQMQGFHNYRADIMLFMAFASFSLIVWLISTMTVPAEVLAIFNMSIGALLKMIGDGFQFEFGSSRGSKEKDQIKSNL